MAGTCSVPRVPTRGRARPERGVGAEPPWRASRQAAQTRLLRFATALRVTRRPPRWEQLIWPKAELPARN